jgi:SAM-dependent methyltransferase
MAHLNPTTRFSSRVESYIRSRPDYPPAILDGLRRACRLTPASVVADIASGTGIFTRHLLENGNRVFSVEPNADMRDAAERLLCSYPNLVSTAGSAEATTLDDASVDLITAAQAAHWFDLPRARREFTRILRPGGYVALLWNQRLTDTTPFLRGYETLLETYSTDYAEVRHERTTDVIDSFFAPAPFREETFPNYQELDYAGLEQRLLSSSYAPPAGHPNYEPMLTALRRIFDAHHENSYVRIEYTTRLFYSQLHV